MKRLTQQEIYRMSDDHQIWLLTEGKQGAQANFRECDLSEMDLSLRDWEGVDFSGSIFYRTKLMCSIFIGCIMENVSMREVDASGSNFSLAKIVNSDCNNSKFNGCEFDFAVLNGSDFGGSYFDDTDLSLAIKDQTTGLVINR